MFRVFRSEVISFFNQLAQEQPFDYYDISTQTDICLYLPKVERAIILHPVNQASNNPLISARQVRYDEKDITAVHLWEDRWIYDKQKVHSRIRSMLGMSTKIHGRSTSIITLDNKRLGEFLNVNHMHVPIKAKYKYGLTFEDKLVAVMSFGQGLHMHREAIPFVSFELLRFCNVLNCTVVGGFGKLLHHFIKQIQPEHIMSYVDADWSAGHAFAAMGFELVDTLPGMEFWLNLKTGERGYPHMLRKGLNLSSMGMDTEEETAFLAKNGYAKVYNSGSYKYVRMLKPNVV